MRRNLDDEFDRELGRLEQGTRQVLEIGELTQARFQEDQAARERLDDALADGLAGHQTVGVRIKKVLTRLAQADCDLCARCKQQIILALLVLLNILLWGALLWS